MQSEPRADVRDMYLAHAMFRGQFGAVPGLVTSVAEGDRRRSAVVADHMRLLENVLVHHHHAEDAHLWPWLLDRAGPGAVAVVALMEAQHDQLDQALADMDKALAPWESSAAPDAGKAFATAVQYMFSLLDEHMTTEERQALPLVEEHITAAEWAGMLGAAGADIPPELGALVFGMMTHDADPEVVAAVLAGMPPEMSAALGPASEEAYAAHIRLLHEGSADLADGSLS